MRLTAVRLPPFERVEVVKANRFLYNTTRSIGNIRLYEKRKLYPYRMPVIYCIISEKTGRMKNEDNKRSCWKIYGMDSIDHCSLGIISAGNMFVDTDKMDQLSFDDRYVWNGADDEIIRFCRGFFKPEGCNDRVSRAVSRDAVTCICTW